MNKYELTVIYSPNLDEERLKAEQELVQSFVTDSGGEIGEIDDWGKRRLAYEIKKFNEGYYQFIPFSAEHLAPKAIEERLRIRENILRFLIIREDA